MSISDIAFTDSVKAEQDRLGSRDTYARVEKNETWWSPVVDDRLREWAAQADSMFFSTANAEGRPYVQHRGGAPGFLRVLDEKTLAFADYVGNRQYVSLGNLKENDRAMIFLIDYAGKRRLKLWGRAEFVEDDPELLKRVAADDDPAENMRVIRFHLEAYDGNCPKHIPRLYSEAEVAGFKARIAELEAKVSA